MKLKLKDEKVVVEGGTITPGTEVELAFHFKNKSYTIQFNDNRPIPVIKNRMKLPEDVFHNEHVQIKVEMKNKSNGVVEQFKSELLPLSTIHCIGKTPDQLYPIAFYEMQKQINELKQRLEALESVGDLI